MTCVFIELLLYITVLINYTLTYGSVGVNHSIVFSRISCKRIQLLTVSTPPNTVIMQIMK